MWELSPFLYSMSKKKTPKKTTVSPSMSDPAGVPVHTQHLRGYLLSDFTPTQTETAQQKEGTFAKMKSQRMSLFSHQKRKIKAWRHFNYVERRP